MPLPSLFRRTPAPRPQLPPGERLYAVGDIHGRFDLFTALLAKIRADAAGRTTMRTRCVILGDMIDRGPQSRELLEHLSQSDDPDLIVLKGNHEAVLADVRRGDRTAAELWPAFGGLATLTSFGVDASAIDASDPDAIVAHVQRVVSDELADWLEALPLSFAAGDYFFVHAGIRPGIAIARQSEHDLLWIRDAFLRSRSDHGRMIVHGHSINQDGIDFARNRIGLDTGAYRTGRLSAVGLEGDAVWPLYADDGLGAASPGATCGGAV